MAAAEGVVMVEDAADGAESACLQTSKRSGHGRDTAEGQARPQALLALSVRAISGR